MFDPAQYNSIKTAIKSISRDGDVITVHKMAFSPDTGAPIEDEVITVSKVELEENIAAYQDYIDNITPFLIDAEG